MIRILRDERGSMSIFLASLFLVFLLLISICVEGVYLYVGKGKAMGAYMAGLSHTRGNYQKELEEMYHVYGMDQRYRKEIEKDFTEKIKRSLEESRDTFRFEVGNTQISNDVFLTDEEGEVLKYQIRQFMKYQMPADLLTAWKEKWKEKEESGKEIPKIQEKMDKEEKESKEKEEKMKEEEKKKEKTKKKKVKTQAKEEKKKEDPRTGFMGLLRQGSVSLVLGQKEVSSLSVPIEYGKKDESEQKSWNFMEKEDSKNQMNELSKKTESPSLVSEFPGIMYGVQYFHNLTSKEKKEGLQYEVEYLIAGKDTEKDNLGSVFWRIIALRFVTNIAYVYTNAKFQEEAMLLATSILGITAMPTLITVAKHLLLLALAYGESVIDVRNLAEGKKVPLLKSEATWQLEFPQLAGLNCQRKPVENGVSYKDYLGLLLVMQAEKMEKYKRMMDLMEANVKQKLPDFKMNQTVAACQMKLDIKLRKLAFGGMKLPTSAKQEWMFQRVVSY